jgi:hypothetical protein
MSLVLFGPQYGGQRRARLLIDFSIGFGVGLDIEGGRD